LNFSLAWPLAIIVFGGGALLDALGTFAEVKHPSRKFDALIGEDRRDRAVRTSIALGRLRWRDRGAPERLVHIGYRGDNFLAHTYAVHITWREFNRFFSLS